MSERLTDREPIIVHGPMEPTPERSAAQTMLLMGPAFLADLETSLQQTPEEWPGYGVDEWRDDLR